MRFLTVYFGIFSGQVYFSVKLSLHGHALSTTLPQLRIAIACERNKLYAQLAFSSWPWNVYRPRYWSRSSHISNIKNTMLPTMMLVTQTKE